MCIYQHCWSCHQTTSLASGTASFPTSYGCHLQSAWWQGWLNLNACRTWHSVHKGTQAPLMDAMPRFACIQDQPSLPPSTQAALLVNSSECKPCVVMTVQSLQLSCWLTMLLCGVPRAPCSHCHGVGVIKTTYQMLLKPAFSASACQLMDYWHQQVASLS